ncbi:MAG: magnesium chelatase [Planctomycetes bacterium SCN 63-9]|nr:MAG: magnesium chelatase [Planctomycetes bacterium SCN 63-9]
MRFAAPYWLWLLLLIPLPLILERFRPRVVWPSFRGFARARRTAWNWLSPIPPILRGLAIGCLAVALARPQTVGGTTRVEGRGVAIVAALDHSSSMNAADFPADLGSRTTSRLEAARATFREFVAGRPDDLIGLVVFANYPDLACPPTIDHSFLIDAVNAVRPATPGDDGTNIGDALAMGLDALRDSPPRKKVLVLLTDGNNEPAVPNPLDPEEGARLAQALGVTLHTIAIGTPGGLLRSTETTTRLPVTREAEGPNLAMLERLAKITGGRAFSATDADGLRKVFEAIDAMEKSPVRGEIKTRYDEQYAPWAASALVLLVVDRLLSNGRLRRLP